jgi:hypothetical protein
MSDDYDEYGVTDDLLGDGEYEDSGGAIPREGSGMLPFEIISGRREAAISGLRQARERLMASLQQPKRDERAKWLAMAAGLLAPTRTGSFGESAGNAAGNIAPIIDRYAQEDAALNSKIAELDYANAVDDYKLDTAAPKIIDVIADDGSIQKAAIVDGVPIPFGGKRAPKGSSQKTLMDKVNEYNDLIKQGMKPEEIDQALGRKGPASTTVNVNTKAEEEYNKVAGKAAADSLAETKTALTKIIDVGNQMPMMAAAIEDAPDGAFGPQGELFTNVVTAAKGLGFDVDREGKWSSAEFANQLVARMTPMQRVVGSGSSSDKDMQLFQDALPNMTKSKQGMQKAMLYWNRLAAFSRKKQKLVDKALMDRNYSMGGQFQADMDALDAQGVFSADDRKVMSDKKLLSSWAKGLGGTDDTTKETKDLLSPEEQKALDDALNKAGVK